MIVPADMDARRYYHAAYQRLEDGRLVLEILNRPTPAVYLSGYAVECILKALLLNATPRGERRQTLDSFRGGRGHNLYWLRDQLRQQNVHLPVSVARALSYAASWSTDIRYEPGSGRREDAERFVEAAQRVVDWANERI